MSTEPINRENLVQAQQNQAERHCVHPVAEPIKTAPKGRWILVFDAHIERWVAAQSMTALEDGAVDWVYARRLGVENAIAFICTEPTHWLPSPPRPGEGFVSTKALPAEELCDHQIAEAVAAEREACAEIGNTAFADPGYHPFIRQGAEQVAALIRARGDAK